MPTIQFTISATDLARLIEAKSQNYPTKIWQNGLLIDNPETRQQFVYRQIREEWKQQVVDFERARARNAVPEPQEPTIT